MRQTRQQGIAIVTVLIGLAIIAAILVAYSTLTINEVRTVKASDNSSQGFYAAEGGLNMRAELIRAKFVGFLRPTGVGPTDTNPCQGGNVGTGDLNCVNYSLNGRTVQTYVQDITPYDAGGNPATGIVGPGETYAGLSYQQYTYRVRSVAVRNGNTEATLEMQFQTRLVPLFQFAAFYQKDLEMHPGPPMTLGGRVHTNSNLYLMSGNSLDINGKVTAGRDIFRKGKDGRTCAGTGVVRITSILLPCQTGDLVSPAVQANYNGNLAANQDILTVPTMASLAPRNADSEVWNKADVRVVAKLVSGVYQLEVQNPNGTVDNDATTALRNCSSTALPVANRAVMVRTNSFWDARENKLLTVMEVNQARLMDCIQTSGQFKIAGIPITANDSSSGGMVWHFSFDDNNASTNGSTFSLTNFAVQISNAARLGTSSGTPPILGLTIATNQQLQTKGDFNSTDKKPAALLADAINIISNGYTVGQDVTQATYQKAVATTVNAAFLSGIDDTVPSGAYNGGLQNYTRFHEDWDTIVFRYRGSFVSLGNSLHVNGRQSATRYRPPNRDWGFDTDFNDSSKLPPLTPRFVYLRQVLFARDY